MAIIAGIKPKYGLIKFCNWLLTASLTKSWEFVLVVGLFKVSKIAGSRQDCFRRSGFCFKRSICSWLICGRVVCVCYSCPICGVSVNPDWVGVNFKAVSIKESGIANPWVWMILFIDKK